MRDFILRWLGWLSVPGAVLALVSCVDEGMSLTLVPGDGKDGGLPNAGTSVVRVNATSQGYNFLRPWEKGNPIQRDGLGAVLPGNRVLVTAEMVEDHTYIELEKADTGEKTPARVVGLDYEVNLALLAPEDETSDFLTDLRPLEIDTSVRAGDTLEVWQLEDNGTGASTAATVIKVSVGRYFVDGSYFLNYVLRGSLQYRAGSFTLPVVKRGKLAGLLLSYNSKDQTSDIISAPIIEHFLGDLEDGDYAGFPNLGLSYAPTLDEQLRKYLELDDYEGGVFVRRVAKDGSAREAGIEENDVIVEVAGYAIDSRGNYDDPDYGKLNFSHLVRGAAEVGDVLPFTVVRNGDLLKLEVRLERKRAEEYLIDPFMFDRGPRFLILGGLIFQELTLPYLKIWGDQWATRAPFKLVHAQSYQELYEDEGREKLVILSATILTPATLGYERLNNLIITKVNDEPVLSIQDLAAALEKPADGIHKIEFDEFPKVIYLDAAMAETVNGQFGERLGISQLERLD